MASQNQKSDQQQLMCCSQCLKVMFANHFTGHVVASRRDKSSSSSICVGVRRLFPNGLTPPDYKKLYEESLLTDQAIIDKIRNGSYENKVSKTVLAAFKKPKSVDKPVVTRFPGPLPAIVPKMPSKRVARVVEKKLPPTKKSPPVEVGEVVEMPRHRPVEASVVANVPQPSPSSSAESSTIAQRLRATTKRQQISYAAFFFNDGAKNNNATITAKPQAKIKKTRQIVPSSSGESNEPRSESSSTEDDDPLFQPNDNDMSDTSSLMVLEKSPPPEKKSRQQKVTRFPGPLPAIIPKLPAKSVTPEPQKSSIDRPSAPASAPAAVARAPVSAATAQATLGKCGLCGSSLPSLAMLLLPCCYRQRTCLWCIVGTCRRGELIKCNLCRFALAPPISANEESTDAADANNKKSTKT